MEAYDWIFDLTVDISARASENGINRTARRIPEKKPIIQNNIEGLGSFRPEIRLFWHAPALVRMPENTSARKEY